MLSSPITVPISETTITATEYTIENMNSMIGIIILIFSFSIAVIKNEFRYINEEFSNTSIVNTPIINTGNR